MYRKKKTTIASATSVVTNEITNDTFLHNLNSEQKRAVTCPTTQSTLVLSGAGLFFLILNNLFNHSFFPYLS